MEYQVTKSENNRAMYDGRNMTIASMNNPVIENNTISSSGVKELALLLQTPFDPAITNYLMS